MNRGVGVGGQIKNFKKMKRPKEVVVVVEAIGLYGLAMDDAGPSRGSKLHTGLRETWVPFYSFRLSCTKYKAHWIEVFI